MHNRNPISSFSRRLPVGTKILSRKRMWAVVHTDTNPVAQIGQSAIIITRTGEGGNGGIGCGVLSWLPGVRPA